MQAIPLKKGMTKNPRNDRQYQNASLGRNQRQTLCLSQLGRRRQGRFVVSLNTKKSLPKLFAWTRQSGRSPKRPRNETKKNLPIISVGFLVFGVSTKRPLTICFRLLELDSTQIHTIGVRATNGGCRLHIGLQQLSVHFIDAQGFECGHCVGRATSHSPIGIGQC